MKQSIWKRVLSLALCLVLLLSYAPILSTDAATGNAYNQVGNKIADAPSVNEWKKFFTSGSTAYAGGVWTDKSVFNSAAEYIAATDESDNGIGLTVDPNNFLVALSAIASNKEITGYSTIPTDTVLVLDLSSSMQNAGAGSGIGSNNSAVDDLAVAANTAISSLLALNFNNRIAVVAYAGNDNKTFSSADGNVQVILPLDRYTATGDRFLQGARDANGNTDYRLQICSGVKNSNGNTISGYMDSAKSTYTQDGVFEAMNLLLGADTEITEGIQAGMSRKPIMVVMTDGEPTLANPNYAGTSATELGNSTMYNYEGTLGRNQSGIYQNLSHRKTIAFVTSLTMAYAKKSLATHYGADPLLYTLAYGTAVATREEALDMLNPAGARTNHTTMWNDFLAGNRVPVYNSNNQITYVRNATSGNAQLTEDDRIYVDKYFSAQSGGLGTAFGSIVSEIEIQSKYYPTFVEGSAINNDGYLEFDDYIGKNMEVKSVKGIQLGSTLYTGDKLAKMIYEGGMGTVQNPTEVGNNLVWSLQKRLGIANAEDVRTLLGNAYANGQLAYNPDTGAYSNYIGWYADQNENFLAFWDGKDDSADAVPADLKGTAYYAIKSYMYYDAVGEGHRKTDMMYATIRVATCVKVDPNQAAEVGDVRVLGRLPASLIPLVEYEVTLKGTDVLVPEALTVTGASAPSRLLYEVGLHHNIDLLDIEHTAPEPQALEKVNGQYVFYTNQWNEGHHNTNTEFSYRDNHNTISFFEPSLENERYYYTYDTPIYADTRGTLYAGANAPTGTVYHRDVTYYKSGNTVTADYEYEPISQHVLEGAGEHSHLTRLSDNTWVVNRGTLHHYFANYKIDKNNNETGTLDVAFMPFVHDNLDDSALHRFHVDFYLGNNGKLTIDPPEGIKISKVTDDTITDKTADYTFTVTTGSSFNEELQLVKEDANGVRTESTITFTNGAASFTLKHSETAWILGAAMTGKTFIVTEGTGTGYILRSVDGDTTKARAELTVAEDTIASTVFENTAMPVGSVVISKAVVSNIADHQNKDFDFRISIYGNRLVAGREYIVTRSDGQRYIVTPENAVILSLKHNQYVTLSGLPAGTEVTAEETDYSSVGFTVNQTTQTATVDADTTKYLNFQNTYKADPVTVGTTITLGGTKHMTSDVGVDGTFTFNLDRYIYADNRYEPVTGGTASVTYANDKGDKSFTIDFDGETYTATGTYYYRVTEVRDATLAEKGIVFDATPFYFSVVVADDGEGNLYISDVTAGTDATVSGDRQNGWTVTGEFTNTYAVGGAAKVVLNMQKTVKGDYGITIPPAGFKFDLYASNDVWDLTLDPVATSSVTGAGGLADIQLVFDDPQTDIGTHYYILKEHIPADADKIPGVDYTNAKYGIKVDVGHESGHFTVSVTTYTLSGSNSTEIKTYTGTATEGIISAATDDLVFTNTFEPDPVTLYIPGTKTLIGRDSLPNEGFYFSTGNATYNHKDGVPKDFRLGYSWKAPGTYTFKVKENIPSDAVNNVKNGLTYDDSVYTITVTVTGDDRTGKLSASYTIDKNGQTVPGIAFVNVYTAEPVTDVVLEASKHLDGDIRKLQVGAYEFELLDDARNVVQTVANGIPTGDYDAPVTFAGLTFDAAGTYNYTIREKLHPEAKAENNYTVHGVKYDTTEYPVVIKVTDPGNGQLVANVEYTGLASGEVPQFVNHYSVTPTHVDFSAKKILTGDSLANHGAFSFHLSKAQWDADTQSVVETNHLKYCDTDANGNIVFSHNDIPELNFEHIGAYRFTIREASPIDPGDMIYDTNYYLIEVDVTDNLQGGLKAETIVTRYDLLGNATPVENLSDVTFTNILPPEPVTIDLSGTKLYNKELAAGQFTFEMYEAEKDAAGKINAMGDPILSATNEVDPETGEADVFKFEDITFTDPETGLEVSSNYLTYTAPGTKYFVVKEKMPDGANQNNVLNGIKYDTTIYEIEITVSLTDVNGRDTLVYDMKVDGLADNPLVFNNEYDAAGDKGIVISGTKELTGRDLEDGEFTFQLLSASKNENIVLQHDLIEEVKNVGNTFSFKEITYPSFSNVGTYYYVVKEKLPEDADETLTKDGITYDDSVYLVTVEVTDNGDGTLKVSDPVIRIVTIEGEPDISVEKITFKNVFTPEPEETIPEETEPEETEPEETVPEETEPEETEPEETEPEETEPEETEPEETEPEETEPEETEPEETEPEETEPEETEPEETEPEETDPEETEPEETEPEETEPEETEPEKPEVPETGDDGRLALWIAMLSASALALAAMLIAGKKKTS